MLFQVHGAQIHLATFFFLMSLFVRMPPYAERGLIMERLWPSVFSITATIIACTIIAPTSRPLHVLASALTGMVGAFHILVIIMDGVTSVHLAFSVLWSLLVLISVHWDEIVSFASAERIVEEGRDNDLGWD